MGRIRHGRWMRAHITRVPRVHSNATSAVGGRRGLRETTSISRSTRGRDIEVEIDNPIEFNIDTEISNSIQTQLIEDFLLKMPTITKIKKSPSDNVLDEEVDFSEVSYQAPTTESYAIILEKQGKYDLAIKVYEKLSLAKPEKRLYFATRISEIALKINN